MCTEHTHTLTNNIACTHVIIGLCILTQICAITTQTHALSCQFIRVKCDAG